MKQGMKGWFYWILPVAGTIFCLWYLFISTCDGIYSDYIRLVNSYLPDVWNPEKFFVPDILTRIPVNYLGRAVNVSFFGYSTMFDRVVGVLGLGAAGLVIGKYCKNRQVGIIWFALLNIIMFSLNKWEMLTNGSGFAHFLAFGFFYYHYMVTDRVFAGEELPYDHVRMLVLPFIITLGVAGPYCAVYSMVIIMAAFYRLISVKRKTHRWEWRTIQYMAASLIPLLLYLWSNSCTVEDHAGAVSVSLTQALMDTPSFFVRFFVKSFSSMILGGETQERLFLTNTPYFILGAVVMTGYLVALWLNLKYALYEKTIMPLILIFSGGLNHGLILASRWIFLDNENYGISSRYALQYQVGILGVVLTFALLWEKFKFLKGIAMKCVITVFCLIIFLGNGYTTYDELKKAPSRKQIFQLRAEASLVFDQKTDQELKELFEFRKSRPDSGQKVREALRILEENNLGVFRRTN